MNFLDLCLNLFSKKSPPWLPNLIQVSCLYHSPIFYYFYCQYNHSKMCIVHLLMSTQYSTNFSVPAEQPHCTLSMASWLPSCAEVIRETGGMVPAQGVSHGKRLIFIREMFTLSHKAFKRSPNSLPFPSQKWHQPVPVTDHSHSWQALEGWQKADPARPVLDLLHHLWITLQMLQDKDWFLNQIN